MDDITGVPSDEARISSPAVNSLALNAVPVTASVLLGIREFAYSDGEKDELGVGDDLPSNIPLADRADDPKIFGVLADALPKMVLAGMKSAAGVEGKAAFPNRLVALEGAFPDVAAAGKGLTIIGDVEPVNGFGALDDTIWNIPPKGKEAAPGVDGETPPKIFAELGGVLPKTLPTGIEPSAEVEKGRLPDEL